MMNVHEKREAYGLFYGKAYEAETVWENWEGNPDLKGLGSMNHYSKGAVCEWLFTTMCGIQIAEENRFLIALVPGGSFTCAKASYQSIYGLVESGWERENGRTVFHITVPANCQAEIVLPDGRKETVSAGSRVYECKEI